MALVLAASTALGALALALYFWTHRVPDPLYHGQRLSRVLRPPIRVWSAANGQPMAVTPSNVASDNALAALKHLGPNAVPLLVSWLKERDSTFKQRARELCSRFGLPMPEFLECRADLALYWLGFIPQHASSAAPSLIEKLGDAADLESFNTVSLLEKIIDTASRGSCTNRAKLSPVCAPAHATRH